MASASGPKPPSPKRPAQTDLFGARPAPPSGPVAPRPPEPPFEASSFSDEEPPPLELLDLPADSPPARPKRDHAAPQQAALAKQQRYWEVVAPQQNRAAAQQRAPEPEPRAYKVAELVRAASRSLEVRFPDVWVEGEISNLKAPAHVYFTLKDEEAQLPAVMFRASAMRLRFRLVDGLKVRARGRLALYEQQGKFQLYVEQVEPAGLGALQLAFEQLKRKLQSEGLFDPARKRPLPFWPRRIGVATSSTGAAVRDIVRVATRRAPVRLLVASCQVQGDGAPAEIVRALEALQRVRDVDVIIVGRGGGSAEDLWAFNDEQVARAIARCRVPVISAVGHEVDYTIADFVADRRAATPSQAAELVVPVHADLARHVEDLGARLHRAGRRAVGEARMRLDGQRGRILALLQRSMEGRRRALRAADERLQALHPRARLARHRRLLEALATRLRRPLPERLARQRRAMNELARRLDVAMHQSLARRRRGFEGAVGKLDALSPLRVLERGYSLVRGAGGHVVTRAEQVAKGDAIRVRLSAGSIDARVEAVATDGGDDEGEA